MEGLGIVLVTALTIAIFVKLAGGTAPSHQSVSWTVFQLPVHTPFSTLRSDGGAGHRPGHRAHHRDLRQAGGRDGAESSVGELDRVPASGAHAVLHPPI